MARQRDRPGRGNDRKADVGGQHGPKRLPISAKFPPQRGHVDLHFHREISATPRPGDGLAARFDRMPKWADLAPRNISNGRPKVHETRRLSDNTPLETTPNTLG